MSHAYTATEPPNSSRTTTPSTPAPPASSTGRGAAPSSARSCSIALGEKKLVNFGSSQAGKSYEAGLNPDEYAATLDKAYGVAGCFCDKETVRSVLTKLKEADTGISIVISGLIDEVVADRRRGRPEAPYGLPLPGRPREAGPFARGRGPAGHDDVRPRHGRLPAHEGGDGPGKGGEDDPREGRASLGPALPVRHLQHRPLPPDP